MTEERRRVLDMLAEGKVTVEEAERLLEALQGTHREARKGRIPPIPSVGALQDTLEGLGEEIEKGLEEVPIRVVRERKRRPRQGRQDVHARRHFRRGR